MYFIWKRKNPSPKFRIRLTILMDAVLAELVTGLIRTDRPWFLSRLVIHPSSAPSYLCIALVSTNCSILVWDLVSWFRCQASGCCRHTCATNISRVSVVAFDCSCFSPSSHSTVPHSYLSMVVLTLPRTTQTYINKNTTTICI